MPAVKDYFDPKKRTALLQDAIRKTKGKGEFTFAFGLGKSGGLLAIDYKDEHSPEKFHKQIKTTDFKEKYIVGKASIKGKIIEMRSAHAKNQVKPKEVKDFLAELKSTVSRAIIDGKGDEEAESAAPETNSELEEASATVSREAARDETREKLGKALEEIDALLSAL